MGLTVNSSDLTFFNFSESQLEKIGNSIIYICDWLKNPVTKTKILKLIYLIEEESVKRQGIPFFNIDFEVWKLGPVAKDIYIDLSDKGTLLSKYIKIESNDKQFTLIRPASEFNDDEFSDNDIQILDSVLENYGHKTADELIKITHLPGSPWYNEAFKNGLLEVFESSHANSSSIKLNLEDLIPSELHRIMYHEYKKIH